MYLQCTVESYIRLHLNVFPYVALTGRRQSGKSTLVRHLFPNFANVSFDDPDEELALQEDPKGYLSRYNGPVIFDEVQRVPVLFRYLKRAIDADPNLLGRFVLTCSNQIVLQKNISKILTGQLAPVTSPTC